MMKKFLLLFMILMLSVSSVSAFDLLASSEITFETNSDDWDGGPAFVVAVVENGNDDTLLFNYLEEELDNGWEMTKDGEISSTYHNDGVRYIILKTDIENKIKKIDDKWFLWYTWAQDWCEDIGGDYASYDNLLSVGVAGQFHCLQVYQSGDVYSLDNGEYMWRATYQIDIEGEGSDWIDMNQDSHDTGVEFSDKHWVMLKSVTEPTTEFSPGLEDKMFFFHDKDEDEWDKISPNFIGKTTEQVLEKYHEYFDGMLSGEDWDDAMDYTNEWIDNYKSPATAPILQYVDEGSITMNSSGQGSFMFKDGIVYKEPIVTITLDADKITIFRSYGEAKITDIDYPDDMVVGQSYPFSITVKNVADEDMSVYVGWENCDDFNFRSIDESFSLDAGDSKILEGTMDFAGFREGCDDSECTIYVKNANSWWIDDEENFDLEVCQESDCEEEGYTECVSLTADETTIRKCYLVNDVLLWKEVAFCDEGCEHPEDGKAECIGGTDYCGNKLCESTEDWGDIGGDGEKITEDHDEYYCEEDCQTDSEKDKDYTEMIIMWVAIGLGVLILGFALVIRLAREGYFNNSGGRMIRRR